MFSSVVAPLTDLTRKGVSWQWGVKEQNAFEEVKRGLLESTAVYKPNYEYQLICMCSHVWRKVSALARMHGCNAYAVSI